MSPLGIMDHGPSQRLRRSWDGSWEIGLRRTTPAFVLHRCLMEFHEDGEECCHGGLRPLVSPMVGAHVAPWSRHLWGTLKGGKASHNLLLWGDLSPHRSRPRSTRASTWWLTIVGSSPSIPLRLQRKRHWGGSWRGSSSLDVRGSSTRWFSLRLLSTVLSYSRCNSEG